MITPPNAFTLAIFLNWPDTLLNCLCYWPPSDQTWHPAGESGNNFWLVASRAMWHCAILCPFVFSRILSKQKTALFSHVSQLVSLLVTGVAYQLLSIIWWFRPCKAYIFWMHIIKAYHMDPNHLDLRRKVWTWTKILSPNIRYFVAILNVFAGFTHFLEGFGQKSGIFCG